ncbi:hypothetical protein Tco_1183949 [Tanacetum coccineum]
MTRSTVKKLKEPLDDPERELHRLRRAASRQPQNDSLAIVGRNLFDNKASSSANSEPKPIPPLKSLREHSSPNLASFQNPIVLLAKKIGNIIDSRDIWLLQGICTFQGLKSENPIYHIQADGATKDTSRLRFFHFTLKGKAKEWQIHINLPFLEAMIHMPRGAKVLKDLLSHKEKLKKAASSVKLSEECSVVIQRSLP